MRGVEHVAAAHRKAHASAVARTEAQAATDLVCDAGVQVGGCIFTTWARPQESPVFTVFPSWLLLRRSYTCSVYMCVCLLV